MAEDEEVWVRKSTVAQQWAHEAHKKDEERILLEEYQRHQKVFDEEGTKRFLLKRDGELKIPLMPNIPKVLDCKVYPLMKEEQDLL